EVLGQPSAHAGQAPVEDRTVQAATRLHRPWSPRRGGRVKAVGGAGGLCYASAPRGCSSGVERCLRTAEVRGSNPLTSTGKPAGQRSGAPPLAPPAPPRWPPRSDRFKFSGKNACARAFLWALSR